MLYNREIAYRSNEIKAKILGITEVQRLHLRLIELATFNKFNGKKVVKDLLNHTDLWMECLMDRGSRRAGNMGILIKLRDIFLNLNNVDTLYLIPKRGKEEELKKLTKFWKADEIFLVDGEMSGKLMGGYPSFRKTGILRLWWD